MLIFARSCSWVPPQVPEPETGILQSRQNGRTELGDVRSRNLSGLGLCPFKQSTLEKKNHFNFTIKSTQSAQFLSKSRVLLLCSLLHMWRDYIFHALYLISFSIKVTHTHTQSDSLDLVRLTKVSELSNSV